MTLLYDLQEVDGQVTVKCCYNGWTLEFSGINKEGEWVSTKMLCSTEEEVMNLLQEYDRADLTS